jgi:hypothetical protein
MNPTQPNHSQATKQSLTSLLVLMIMFFTTQLDAQNFTWLYGASGTSNGQSVTCDQYGHTFVAGGYKPKFGNLGFAAPNYFPNLVFNNEKFRAFLVRYNTETGDPQFAATIGVESSSGQGACPAPDDSVYVTAHRIAVDRDRNVFVLGVFTGCNITLFDTNGISIITTNSSAYSDLSQKAFLARYDSNFFPISCHIYSSGSEEDVYPGDLTNAATPAAISMVCAVNIISPALVESFGSALPVVPPYDNFTMTSTNDYDIYITQLDIAADQIVNGESVGRKVWARFLCFLS